jgi:hypothetical protein
MCGASGSEASPPDRWCPTASTFSALDEVHATVDARNLASLAVLAKVGFISVREEADGDGSTTVVLTCCPDTVDRTH